MTKKLLITGLLIALLALMSGCATATGDTETNSTTSTIYMIVFLVIIFALFWFTMVRPQRKRQKEHENMMRALQKGDRVITAGGIYGSIESLDDESVVIKIESGGTIRVARGSVVVRREK